MGNNTLTVCVLYSTRMWLIHLVRSVVSCSSIFIILVPCTCVVCPLQLFSLMETNLVLIEMYNFLSSWVQISTYHMRNVTKTVFYHITMVTIALPVPINAHGIIQSVTTTISTYYNATYSMSVGDISMYVCSLTTLPNLLQKVYHSIKWSITDDDS